MALLVDDDHITTADLLAIDPEVSDIADAEGITVEGDGGIVRQAWDECADKLTEATQTYAGELVAWPGLFTNLGFIGASRARVQMTQIVVSAPYGRRASPLRRWMIYAALVLFYRAASNRRTSDRYESKHDRMADEIRRRWRALFASGLPVVLQPLPAPGAIHEQGAGDFDALTALSFAASTGAAGGNLDVAITWVAAQYVSQDNKQNAESGPSKILTVEVPTDKALTVSIAGLVPPGSQSYQGGTADGLNQRRTATGWNVYVGAAGGTLYLQNSTPISLSATTYNVAATPVSTGYVMGTGQYPDFNLTFQNTIGRG